MAPLLLLGLIVGVVVQDVFDGMRLITDVGWVAGFLISAVLIQSVGRRLNRQSNRHTLYDSPMQNYWWLAFVCAILAAGIVLLTRLPG
ncbi:hypothetical protein BAY61_05010 [Prauserella marina]|nr:hypothetical protein BAY61_05010 [Prauserella marina]